MWEVRRYIIYMREDICDGVCGKSRHVFVSKQVVELISHKLILSPTSHNWILQEKWFILLLYQSAFIVSLFDLSLSVLSLSSWHLVSLFCLCQFWALSLLAPVLSCLPSSYCWKDTSNQAGLENHTFYNSSSLSIKWPLIQKLL